MKKVAFLFVLFAAFTAGIFAQTAALPRLAVVEFSTNVNNEKIKAAAVAMRDLVESQMAGMRRYRVMTRNEIDTLIKNQQIQVSSIASSENIKKLSLANINYVVTGSVNALGDDYSIIVRLLDVSTGEYPHSANDLVGSASRDFVNGINGLMKNFVAGLSADGDKVVQSGTYNVGDIGPAGGYIFYDKGTFSNGWRYLEAAPFETEFTAQWGASGQDIPGTVVIAGSGKQNTQLIVERLGQLRERGRAAQSCASLNFDGFSDWFLPSKDELDLMFKNLKQKGLGNFNNNWYWSSSQNNRDSVWNQSFSDGKQINYGKIGVGSVRAIRAF